MQNIQITDSSPHKPIQWRLPLTVFILFLAGLLLVYYWLVMPAEQLQASETTLNPGDSLPAGIRQLLQAYPEHLVSATANTLVWKDGTVMPYDDGIENKDYETLLTSPDLEDQMRKQYVKGREFPDPTAPGADTSKAMYTPFFEKMYGSTREEVLKNMRIIRWLPKTQNLKLYVTTVNGIDERLKAISAELEDHPEWLKYVRSPGGTFNWRNIRGSSRRSVHSFGIAIDLNIRYADFWLWDKDLGRPHKYKNRYPLEVIELFEKHGFIWGGKWYYYDTMHFEYRPELLAERDSLQ